MIERMVLGVAVVVSLSGAAWAQVKAGSEFQVNTYTIGRQWIPVVAVERDADYTIAWVGLDASDSGILGQRFDATGARRGDEFQVNTFTTSYQGLVGGADVSVGPKGDFVVVWPSLYQDGDGLGVFGQRYDSNGARAGAEFQVNTYTTGYQGNVFAGSVAVAKAPNGSFVVVWDDTGGQDGSYGVLLRRYDAAGNPLGAEMVVNTYTTGVQQRPDIAMDGGGNFVVVWGSYLQDGSGYGVFGRRFDAAGAPQGGEFQVNTYTTGNQSYRAYFGPTVARARDGAFVVAWDDTDRDGDTLGIFAQRFDAQGNPAGSDFRVNSYTTGVQGLAAFGIDDLGNFVVTWTEDGTDGDSLTINGRRFNAAGTPRGAEFIVNSYTPAEQFFSEIGSDDVGNFVITWTVTGQDGDDFGVFGQRFGGLRPAALAVDAAGNGVWEPGETVAVRPSWRNINGAAQTFAGGLSNLGGPAATYGITDGVANYGTVANGASAPCTDCYAVSVNNPPTRPAQHWDAAAVEAIVPDLQGQQKRWTLHVGATFADVPTSNPFYRFVETLVHRGVTGGCNATSYCPAASTTRAQMAVFVLVAREGAGFLPPACTTPVFNDVPASSPFCRWIEELFRRGVVTGCGGGNYCPDAPVTREQIPVFVLRTVDPALNPPACTTPVFNDVPASSPFCRWIEELVRRGVVTGCGSGNYCPRVAVTREQMGVFITVTFGLTLYGP